MSIVLDTGLVLAVYNRQDHWHAPAVEFVQAVDEDLVTTPLVIAELEQLVRTRGDRATRDAFYADLEAGVWHVRWWADGLTDTLAIVRREPTIDLVDASLVALAALLRTDRIATFDPHFTTLTTARGDAFVMLPAAA